MATKKHRVNITVDDDMFTALNKLSKQKEQSLSKVGAELISLAIELDEDRFFSSVADKRLASAGKRIGHEQAWK